MEHSSKVTLGKRKVDSDDEVVRQKKSSRKMEESSSRSDRSTGHPMSFNQPQPHSSNTGLTTGSTNSKVQIINFRKPPEGSTTVKDVTSIYEESLSEKSMGHPMSFQHETKPVQYSLRSWAPSVCCVCEDSFEDDSLVLDCSHRVCLCCTETDTDLIHCPKCGTKQKIKPTPSALRLQTENKPLLTFIEKFKTEMLNTFSMTNEGNEDEKSPLKHIFTSLSVNFGNRDVPQEHYAKRIMKLTHKDSHEQWVDLSEFFESSTGHKTRTILSNGVAGIGKSFSVQKLIVDWAEGAALKGVGFVFCLAFRELNLVQKETSLFELLKDFHPGLSELQPQYLNLSRVIIILDSFDESRFDLNFEQTKRVSSVQEKCSVLSLILNLIQRNLLPSAQLWITSRPAAAHQIPGKFIHTVTEIQGFNDQQKEEYFKKRFSNKPDLANMAISHMKSSLTLDLLCQIPIFCWLFSVLFEEVYGGEEEAGAPQTLTEMMGAFIFVQTKRSSRKFDKNPEEGITNLLKAKKSLLLKLGKLAFIHLLNNNLIFYEDDLKQCELDPKEVTVKSGFFNTILREEMLSLRQKVYSFVHLTVQEFFAALYVYDCFTNNKPWASELSNFMNLESESSKHSVFELLKTAVNKVLERNRGHLYFFQRFLLGLLHESNQRFIPGLLVPVKSSEDIVKRLLVHFKTIRGQNISPDACINLFQTMVEMGNTKTSEEIQEYLKSDDRPRFALTPLHCSALAFTMQVSKNILGELDFKSFNTSEEGRRRLIPAVRTSRKADLTNCRVTEVLLKPLSMALTFPHSSLRHLDLTNNDLRDSGVKLLCEGISSPVCKLQTLRLSGCLVTEEGCESLVSALKSNPSYMKELDLSYNNLQESGEKALNNLKSDPKFNLSHLQIDTSNGGKNRMIPGLKKYLCDLTWDRKSSDKEVEFLDEDRALSRSEAGPNFVLVRGKQAVSGRCYFEIEASEPLNIGVMYYTKDLKVTEFKLGRNPQSWSFVCSSEGSFAFHNNESFSISTFHASRSSRLGIYLDQQSGVLSFYRVFSDSRVHLYTFRHKFTDVMFAAAELRTNSTARFHSDKNK